MRRNRCGLAALLAALVLACSAGCAQQPARTEVAGRILLTYPGYNGNQALTVGVVAVNPKGCITVGRWILVAPEGSTLLPDGSPVIDGRTLRFGERVDLGGSMSAETPPDSPCGPGRYWRAGG